MSISPIFTIWGGAQALLVGGSNQIAYSIRIKDGVSDALLYQIDLQDQSGYAPGGIIGLIAEASSDDEQEMSQKLAERLETTVLRAKNIAVARGTMIEHVVNKALLPKPVTVGGTGSSVSSTPAALKNLEAAAGPISSKSEAFSRLPNGPLEAAEIKALFSGLSVTTSDPTQEYHTFDRKNGILGHVPGGRPNNGILNDDVGTWSVSPTARLCQKWADWYSGSRNCYRVSKSGETLMLKGSYGEIRYSINN